MGLYNKQGLLNGYKKNNKERDALDFYATPVEEVTNILEILNLDFSRASILEPCAGGGHMVKGILDYIYSQGYNSKLWTIKATDIKERPIVDNIEIETGLDFLSDEYPYNEADYVIINPPYSTIEPFVIRGLEIAKKGLLVLARLQFLEGKSRYDNILRETPPTDTFIYVDRIKCYKNGDFSQTESSAQAYVWVYWDKEKMAVPGYASELHWMRRK
ncbi:MAG: SAM-dependent methyltransferase [Lachnospiraceae bacterium]|nr:SAM-dependent methyltransferase [Lachnospiraceae bacterium]